MDEPRKFETPTATPAAGAEAPRRRKAGGSEKESPRRKVQKSGADTLQAIKLLTSLDEGRFFLVVEKTRGGQVEAISTWGE